MKAKFPRAGARAGFLRYAVYGRRRAPDGKFPSDFLGNAPADQSLNQFAIAGQPLFWGVGGEVIIGRVGFGGDIW